ncbi:MAG: hypothetical protein ACHQQR_14705 [Gemmatimonadales bacterium]
MIGDLTPTEVRLARARGIFTVTTETAEGYYVTAPRLDPGLAEPVRLGQSKVYVRPSTARRHGARLVRAALMPPKPKAARRKHTPWNPNACPICAPTRCEVARRMEQRR